MSLSTFWNRYLRLPLVIALICAVTFVLCVVARRRGRLQPLEIWAYDAMLRNHLQPSDRSAAGDILVLGVDESDYQALTHYPLTDRDKAVVLERLENVFKAKAIGSDIFMDIPIGGDAAGTERLRQDLGKYRNIVAGYLLGNGTFEHPEVPAPLMINSRGATARMANRRVGFVDQGYIPFDGIGRTGLVYMTRDAIDASGESQAGQSLSVGVANQFLEAEGILKKPDPAIEAERLDPAHLRGFWEKRIGRFHANDGGFSNADQKGFQYLIDFRSGARYPTLRLRQVAPELFTAESLATLLPGDQLPIVDPAKYQGKVVLFGSCAASVKDYIATPLDPAYNVYNYGVFQHANLVDQLVRTARGAQPLRVLTSTRSWLWALLWISIGAAGGLSARIGYSPHAPWRLLLIALAGEAIIIAVSIEAFIHGLWIPMVPPTFCWAGALFGVGAYISQIERADRNTLNKIFVRICQKEVAAELWKRRDELMDNGRLKPRKLTATLMFGDLKGFSTASEKLDPSHVIEWINQYHDTMTAVVTKYHGVIVRYMGDGMMAVFGAPACRQSEEQYPIDAQDAVNCALEMRRKLADLHVQWAEQGLPCLAMRLGIHTGVVVEGSVGSASRFEYVTLGDTTNTAARLETHDKTLMDPDVAANGCRILIGDPTYEFVQQQVTVRVIGEIALDGKKNMLKVYGVTGPAVPAPPSDPNAPPMKKVAKVLQAQVAAGPVGAASMSQQE